jgi:hypothetical protein
MLPWTKNKLPKLINPVIRVVNKIVAIPISTETVPSWRRPNSLVFVDQADRPVDRRKDLMIRNYSTRSDQAFPGDGGLNGLEG